MAANVTKRKGRGSTVSPEDVLIFLDWLARTGNAEEAATLAMVPLNAMKMRKSRNKKFRTAWELARGTTHKAMVEDFFLRLEETSEAKSSYLAAGLTEGWYYRKMVRDDAFRARVKRTIAIAPNKIAKKVVDLAENSDNIADLLKVLNRMLGNNTPGTPRGG